MLDDSIEDDLEELEVHLYSQIHHSHVLEEEPQVVVQAPQLCTETPEISEAPQTDMRPKTTKNRYFKDGNNTLSKKNERKTFSKPESCAPKKQSSVGNAQRSDRIIIDKVVVLQPYKSIVCVSNLDGKAPNNTSAKRSKRALRRAKAKARKLQEKIENAGKDEQEPVVPASDDNLNKTIDSVVTISDDEVDEDIHNSSVVTADSEFDSKKEAKPLKTENSSKFAKNTEIVADKETSTPPDDGDVIFVKAVVPVVEVIDIDEDSVSLPEKNSSRLKTTSPKENLNENNKANEPADNDTETSSVVSSSNSSVPHCSTPKKRRQVTDQERKELLSTPESTSNDFLDNSDVAANQFKFNFSLHGSDFTQGEFLKPSNPITERCESESTSSIGDVNAALKSVFSEVEFPSTSASNMFSEGNLENFSDYITPVRRSLPDESSAPAKSKSNADVNKSKKGLVNDDCDSSSSESDYEMDAQRNVLRVKKNHSLPILSPMVPEKEPAKSGTKRKMSQQGLSSKFDLLADESAEDPTSETKKSKRKSALQKKAAKRLKKKKVSAALREKSPEKSETETTPVSETKKKRVNSALRGKSPGKSDTSETTPVSEAKKKRVSPALREKSPEKSDTSETAPTLEVQICEPDSTKNVEEPEESSNKSNNENEASQLPEVDENLDQTLVENEEEAASAANVIEILSDDENEPVMEVVSEKVKELDSFVIVDETFGSESHVVASDASDSETHLSLGETVADDLQLGNCSESPKKQLEIVNEPDEQQTATKTGTPKKRKQKKMKLHKCTVAEVQSQMSNDPQMWEILPSDRVLFRTGASGKRCWHCKELGHKTLQCPNPHKPPKCKLCGHMNHMESRCPNRICMQCGRPNFDFTEYCRRCFHLRGLKCHLCDQFGHTKDRCPDLWRRYHSTTEDGPLVVPDGPALKPANQLWCSNCAKQGHLEYKCRRYSSTYIQLDPTVRKYDEIYIASRTPKKNSPRNQNPNDNNSNNTSPQDNDPDRSYENNDQREGRFPQSPGLNSPQRKRQMSRFGPVSPRKIQVTFTNHGANEEPNIPVPSVNYVSPFSQNFAGPDMNMADIPLILNNLSPLLRNDLPRLWNGRRGQTHPYANFDNTNFERPFVGDNDSTMQHQQQHDFPRTFLGRAQQLLPPVPGIEDPMSLAPGPGRNPNSFYFEDNLPSFVSFDADQPAVTPDSLVHHNDIDDYNPAYDDENNDMREQDDSTLEHQEDSNERYYDDKNKERLFLTQSAREIQQFLAQEFRKLRKLEAEWRSGTTKYAWETSDSYRRENMILFGVKMMNRGQYHMGNLIKFRRMHRNTKLTTGNRKRLYVSYKYIFGTEKHDVKNYRQFLHS